MYGFANGILIPNIQTQISILAPAEFRGAFMSINSSVLRLGQTIGPLISGIVITRLGEGWVFGTGIAFALFTAVFISHGVHEMGKLEVK
jgi:MFS family permease